MGKPEIIKVKCGDIDFRGYEVVRTQFFTDANMISVTFSRSGIRFSIACVRQFGKAEHIEMLVFPKDYLLVVHLCPADHKNKIQWAKACNDKIQIRKINASAFVDALYELFDWNVAYKYRLRGEITQLGSERVLLFNTREFEVIILREIAKNDTEVCNYPQSSDEEGLYIASQSKNAFTLLPQRWQTGFGNNYYSNLNTRLPDIPIGDTVTDYNSQPELNPTAPELIGESMRQLLLELQSNEVSDGNWTSYDIQ